jgi:hypothetical protein
MTYSSSWYGIARECRMRAAEARARADEMREAQPKAIILGIAADYEELADWFEKTQYLGGIRNRLRARTSSTFAMRSSDCEIIPRLSEIVLCRSDCSRRKSRRLFRIEATIVSRSLGKCNGWSDIAALLSLSRRERARVSQPPTPWAEPQPVMNDNLHHPSRFHRREGSRPTWRSCRTWRARRYCGHGQWYQG